VRRCTVACRRQTLAVGDGQKRSRQPISSATNRATRHGPGRSRPQPDRPGRSSRIRPRRRGRGRPGPR
jgi:hypothetical protein